MESIQVEIYFEPKLATGAQIGGWRVRLGDHPHIKEEGNTIDMAVDRLIVRARAQGIPIDSQAITRQQVPNF